MGRFVENLPHSCGTTRGLQVYQQKDGRFDAYCWACHTYVAEPYKGMEGHSIPEPRKEKSKEQIDEQMDLILSCPSHAIPERKLKREYIEYFNIKVGVSQQDGKIPQTVFFPYTDKEGSLVGFKARILDPKKMWAIGSLKGVTLFGWEQAKKVESRKKLFITEGEFDAVALFQIIKETSKPEHRHYNPAVVSLPHGAGSAVKTLTPMFPEIKKLFQEIVFVPDLDEAGKKAAESVAKNFPEITIATIPDKDCNECLINGHSRACRNSVVFQSSKPKNTRIVLGSSLIHEAKKKPKKGLPWPFKGFTEATRGRRRGETYYFGAGVKMGKSELVDTIVHSVIVNDNLPAFVAKVEQKPADTYKRIVGKEAGRIFHDPNLPFDEKAFDEAEVRIRDKLIVLDSYQDLNWETVKEDIKIAHQEYGVADIFIDPITCFTNHMNPADANTFLINMTAEAAKMAMDHNLTFYFFCHLKAPETGKPHERGGKIFSSQFAGSRAMMRSCNLMVGFEGNKDPDLPEEMRNTRRLVILEDREFGSSDVIPLFWDKNTGLFHEMCEEF